MTVNDIDWGAGPPGAKGSNHRTGRLRCEQLATAASMRPGVWGRYEYETTTQATGYALRLRRMGLHATARGAAVYFREPA